MTDILTEIVAKKRVRVARAKEKCGPEALLLTQAREVRRKAKPHALKSCLSDTARVNVIAEIKRASPSKGIIKASADPVSISEKYERGGAAAISVLTEEDFFRGSLDDLRAVRANVSLPLLRKDFIFDEFQIYETALAGADALLLIVAMLNDKELTRLRRITEDDLGMDALVEVHTRAELQRARKCGATLIGVNNRDLHSFKVSLDVSVELARNAPPDVVLVSESGLRDGADLRRLRALGFKGFLIGETLMTADEPERALRMLLEEANSREGAKG